MAKLPTMEELKQLYRDKGHDALVWLTWRNALRSVIDLDHAALAEVWPDDMLKYNTYSVFSSPVVIAQWLNRKDEVLTTMVGRTKDTFFSLAFDGPIEGIEKLLNNFANTYAVAASPDPQAKSSQQLFDYCAYAYFSLTGLEGEQLIATKQDYDLLCIPEFILNFESWFSKPLWQNDCPPTIGDRQTTLVNNLNKLGLGFIADDLTVLWDMQPLSVHAKNYLKDISEADINNPEALHHIILDGESNKIHAVRTLLLGPGGAGKSSLADRLQGKPVELIKTPTQGIEYQNHQPLNLQKAFPESNPEEKDLSIYLWDFGGQTIFHGLHRAFLHENCVYILVVDSRHEQAPDEWLHQIRHLAGGDATVLLVTNQHDGCDIHQNEKRLLREFPDILGNSSFHYFSCIDSEASGLTAFVNELTKAALKSQRTVWKETLNIHQAIREYTEQTSSVFISMTHIKKIIRDNGRVADDKAMIESLEQLGFLASITKGKLSYCLKPEWAVDCAYELLNSGTLRDNEGRLDLMDFDKCFVTEPTGEQQDKLLDFLDHRSLCFELPKSGEYFFPDAAIADEPDNVADLLKQQRLQVRFDLPYLPLGFHTRLVKPLFNQTAGIKDSQHIWRQGFITQHAESNAVVQYLLRKSSIEVTLVGNPEHYATLLDKFYTALCSAVSESKTRLQPFTIRPFVFLEKGLFELGRTKESQAFSVHSVAELVKVLQAATSDNLEQVNEGIKAMATDKKGETHHHYHDKVFNTDVSGDGQTAVGSDNATMNQYMDKSHTEITAEQRNQIATIVGELLKDAGNLPTEQLVAVSETKKALEAPSAVASKSLLSEVWSGVDKVLTTTKDKVVSIADFVIKNKESLGAAFVTAMAALGNL